MTAKEIFHEMRFLQGTEMMPRLRGLNFAAHDTWIVLDWRGDPGEPRILDAHGIPLASG